MILRPDDIQAAFIALLKANVALVAALPEGASGIREASWHGTDFQFPNVRVQRVTMSAWGDGNCTPIAQHVQVTVVSTSKLDSSKTAQTIQGLVLQALDGQSLDSAAVRGIIPIRLQVVSPVSVIDETQHWVGSVTVRTVVKPK